MSSVDLRAGTPGFGAWHAVEITADNRVAIYIPPSFISDWGGRFIVRIPEPVISPE